MTALTDTTATEYTCDCGLMITGVYGTTCLVCNGKAAEEVDDDGRMV